MANLLIQAAVSVAVGAALRILTPDTKIQQESGKLDSSKISAASEGTAITELWGRHRVPGHLIWATKFREVTSVSSDTQEGKGGPSVTSETVSYRYRQSFAVGLCQSNGGRIRIGRIWFDSEELDQSTAVIRVYDGSDSQVPDSLIEEIEGDAPAYKGLAYLVFDDFDVTPFGNRIPQITVEVTRTLDEDPDRIEENLRAVSMIPGAGEFVYGTQTYFTGYDQDSSTENVNQVESTPDVVVSLDQLEEDVTNISSVELVVSWFGDDLRCGECEIKPKIDYRNKTVRPVDWRVSSEIRRSADLVSMSSGTVAFGGTPSDLTVRESLSEIKSRGHRAVFYPFIMMDIEAENTLLNPYSDDASIEGQPVYPWRGRITCSPAPGYLNSVDKTSESESQVASFVGTSQVSDFSLDSFERVEVDTGVSELAGVDDEYYIQITFDRFVNVSPGARISCTVNEGVFSYVVSRVVSRSDLETIIKVSSGSGQWPEQSVTVKITKDYEVVNYSGPEEWTFRRMVLHYANLCKDILETGDAFIIGTEMVGMTTVRSSSDDYPFVNSLVAIVADVKSILPVGVEVSYAADWSEYHSHRPDDGTGDVFFNMDPLWAVCDFVGIDNYLPLTDWRTEDDYDYRLDHIMDGIEGGEYYDYHYSSYSDRQDGIQTPIEDLAYSKDWVFRQKDIRNWWQNSHVNRPSGVEDGLVSDWVSSSKPIWFTEFGCAAIDKGANQPNVFLDPKSSESFIPHFSSGSRDDLIQRRYLEATVKYWSENSPVGMISSSDMFAWTWDARPYPNFPYGDWGDRDNWSQGHWLNGRLNMMYLKDVIKDLGSRVGMIETDFEFSGLDKFPVTVRGYMSTSTSSPRDIIEEIALVNHTGILESEGLVKVYRKRLTEVNVLSDDDLITSTSNSGGFEILTAQETDVPQEIVVTFTDETNSFQDATANGKRQVGSSQLVEQLKTNSVLEPDEGRNLAEEILQERSLGRQTFKGTWARDILKYDPGDMFDIEVNGREATFRIDELTIGMEVSVEATRSDRSIYTPRSVISSLRTTGSGAVSAGSSLVEFIDIPLQTDSSSRPWAPRVIAHQKPWSGGVIIYEDDESGGYTEINNLEIPATVGETKEVFPSGITNRWDNQSVLRVEFYSGVTNIISLSDQSVLNGSNTVAVKTSSGWELVQFASAILVDENTYDLSRLLRGRNGTEYAIEENLGIGSRVVFLDNSWGSLNVFQDQLGISKNYRYGPSNVTVGDSRYTDVTETSSGRPLMPFSPVHLKRKSSGSDHILQWIRRSRLNSDSWEGTVPINEESESYEVDIYDDLDVVRTISVASGTSITYTSAQQKEDFGGSQTRLKFSVYQISASVGRGEGATYDDT